MEIRNLNTFLKVATLHNFTHAAKELGYSQSNVSAQIQQLEQEVGIREQRRDKALILNRLGSLYRDMGEPDRAQECFAQACRQYERQSSRAL